MLQDISDDERLARQAEEDARGRTHNLLNVSVAAGYRNGAANAEHSEAYEVRLMYPV